MGATGSNGPERLTQTLEPQKFSLTNTAIIFNGLIFTRLITTIMMTLMILGISGFWATVKDIKDSSIAQLLQNRRCKKLMLVEHRKFSLMRHCWRMTLLRAFFTPLSDSTFYSQSSLLSCAFGEDV